MFFDDVQNELDFLKHYQDDVEKKFVNAIDKLDKITQKLSENVDGHCIIITTNSTSFDKQSIDCIDHSVDIYNCLSN